jgi:hypothetical protein
MEFYYDSTVEPFRRATFETKTVFDLLSRISGQGVGVVIHDTAGWAFEMISETYHRVCPPHLRRKYALADIFGTETAPGLFFGRQVPALVIFDGEIVVDVYPHREGHRVRSVQGFLEEFSGRG